MNRILTTRRPALCRALLLLALLLLCACAPRIELPRHDEAADDLAAFRTRFVEPGAQGQGVAVRASLLYSTPTKANRTDVQLFGDYERPLRLDVRAGLGTMLALMREDQSGLLAFYPNDKRAYAHSDPVIGAQLLGLPFPFALRDLALVLGGHFGTLVPDQPVRVRAIPGGGFAFSYDSGPCACSCWTSTAGPSAWRACSPSTSRPRWSAMARPSPAPACGAWPSAATQRTTATPLARPKPLRSTLPKGDSAVLRVRSVTVHEEPWTTKALTLTLPANAEFISLERQAAPAQVREVITGGGDNER